ncbi:MAG TPA: double-strand break repair helicase AddA [Xanthobacteraceae bacterium]|nr:double-strand break repair helicase AddA [Xanthobacteraceae bacterium]
MKPRPIPEHTRHAQADASDPGVSAWVAANAGAGKTYVLVRRAIRLLLAGVPPARILCLTYTKAAAAHMANQVLNTLREWVSLDDDALDEKLAAIDSLPKSAARRAAARRLFATAIETPGGLKVQTIHAFCDRVLHQFPFEARVPAGFEVLDEASENEMLNRVRGFVLLAAAREPESELGRAFATAVAAASDKSLSEVFDEAIRARKHLRPLLETGGLGRAAGEIAAALGLEDGDSLAKIEKQIAAGEHLPRSEWASVAATLQAMDGNARACGERLAAAATAREHANKAYLSVFFTDGSKLRAENQFGSAAWRAEHPALFQRLYDERARLSLLMEKRRAAETLERTHALNVIARAMIERYEEMKRARGVLDYDDLIGKTADLLANEAAAWVHYKLDGGIDHILIDEAQDTSPEQWTIVEKLAEEFFAGRGARENRARTIFAVGDEKQSIFAFQGADPAGFHRMRRAFKKRLGETGQAFHDRRLDLSFRSAAGIVDAVDAVFARPLAFRGLSKDPDEKNTVHQAIRDDMPARVEIWDTVTPPEEDMEELAWDAPLDARSATGAPTILAGRIARAVKRWLAGGMTVGDTPRVAEAGDIIILVRQRGPLFEAILRALKHEDIAVAGADRLQLAGHLAVMDIAALCDALLLESNDLALACALKSPLLGLSEEDLFHLAHARTGTLADALKAAESDARFAEAASKIALWRAEARRLRPFDFLSRVLGRDGGRAQILERLGAEAADALDELLAHALAYEAVETPSLQGFLAFLRRSGSQIKRDLEVESSAVRVMTVHGAKGLEAPIVVLADTTFIPEGRNDPWLLPLSKKADESPKGFVWALAGKDDSEILVSARRAVREAEEEEHRRLLYVALTRARDAIIVCGAETKRHEKSGLPENCWYRLVRDALAPELEEWPKARYGFDGVWRWRPEAERSVKAHAAEAKTGITPPEWFRKPAPTDGQRTRERLVPSTLLPLDKRSGEAAKEVGLDALRRGSLIHRLLQELPKFSPESRRSEAARFLARVAPALSDEMREALLTESLAVLDLPDFAPFFGRQSRGEVELLGRLPATDGAGGFEIAGRIDRLVVSDDTILIADYKTDARAPANPADAPEAYVAQLALYRALLARSFPGRAMRAFLVWTAGPAIHEVPEALLDRALRRVTST